QDVYSVLEDGFHNIREQYWDMIGVSDDEAWPSETQLKQLATAASGLFVFASTVLKFVGEDNQEGRRGDLEAWGTPVSRLELCLKTISSRAAGEINPLSSLDLLYQQILSTIPPSTLPITMRVLGLCILFPDSSFRAQDISNFFSLDQATFYNSLR